MTELTANEFDSANFRQAMASFCTGVTVVTGLSDGVPVGFTAASVWP